MNAVTAPTLPQLPSAAALRVFLVAVTLTASLMLMLYALAFVFAPWVAAVVIAAAACWVVLFAGVWLGSPRRLRWPRIDWCLWTVGVGIVVLLAGAAAVLLTFVGLGLIDQHLPWSWNRFIGVWLGPAILPGATLLAADGLMAHAMIRHAPRVGVPRRLAAAVWFGGMNGLLLALVAAAWALGWTG
ncbi:MAG: hypothetical protein AAF800_13525 [Planctomycetota bacterium]